MALQSFPLYTANAGLCPSACFCYPSAVGSAPSPNLPSDPLLVTPSSPFFSPSLTPHPALPVCVTGFFSPQRACGFLQLCGWLTRPLVGEKVKSPGAQMPVWTSRLRDLCRKPCGLYRKFPHGVSVSSFRCSWQASRPRKPGRRHAEWFSKE